MSTTDPTHTTLSTACWNSDHHPDRCAESLADGDVCDCRCHTSNPATAAPSGPATFQECIAAWPQATDCTDNPEWGTHMCDEVVDHAGDHVCTCGQHVPQCRAEYAPERRDPTARIVACSLARGHNGDHTELFTEATWPQTAVPGTAAPATPGQLDLDAITDRAEAALEWVRRGSDDGWLPLSVREHFETDVPALLAQLRDLSGDLDASELAEAANEWDGLQQALDTAVARVVELESEVQRVSGQLVERTDRLMETLHKRNELAERLELAEEAEAGASGMLRDARRQLETWRTRALATETGDLGVYQLPAEPAEHVTELWDHEGVLWEADAAEAGWLSDDSGDICSWSELLTEYGPLSTTPPAETAPAWRCERCRSTRWVGYRAGPEHEGWPRRAQCVPCGHVQATPPAGTEGEHADQG